mmetsp:Transcript_5121/g.15149  ORF Transcript_5121/g.15149 Transcript_5121/m.15149 type:complete len:207 (+) Transcript_5121:1121-1741(+)
MGLGSCQGRVAWQDLRLRRERSREEVLQPLPLGVILGDVVGGQALPIRALVESGLSALIPNRGRGMGRGGAGSFRPLGAPSGALGGDGGGLWATRRIGFPEELLQLHLLLGDIVDARAPLFHGVLRTLIHGVVRRILGRSGVPMSLGRAGIPGQVDALLRLGLGIGLRIGAGDHVGLRRWASGGLGGGLGFCGLGRHARLAASLPH